MTVNWTASDVLTVVYIYSPMTRTPIRCEAMAVKESMVEVSTTQKCLIPRARKNKVLDGSR